MTKQLLTVFIFLSFSLCISAQGQEEISKEQKLNKDTLTYILYQKIKNEAKNQAKKLIPEIEKLVAQGADMNGTLYFKESYRKPLTYIPIIKDFYKKKYRTYIVKKSPFHEAVAKGNIKVVKKMLDLGADINALIDKTYPINEAVKNDDANMIYFLLDNGAEIEQINLALIKNIDVIEALVARGADPKKTDWNFALDDTLTLKRLIALNPEFENVKLNFRKVFNDNELFDFLLCNGMPMSTQGIKTCSLIFGAVKYNNLYALKIILANPNVDVNAVCKERFEETPLSIAIDNENTKVMALLLQHGADPMQKDWTGKISLNQAVFCDNPEPVVKLLVNAGADIEYSGYFHQTPLMHAVKLDEYLAALAYIKNGANVNAKNSYGDTPLKLAIEAESLPILKLLVENGADTHAKIEGMSIVEFAEKEETPDAIIEYLRNL